MASEGELGRKWDRCLADSAVKLDERFPWEISLCAELRGQRDASCPE